VTKALADSQRAADSHRQVYGRRRNRLQLKSHPDTAQIPVLVCSVINDPHLALSLGAASLLRKPATAEQLLTAVASAIGI
jgi:CheY-like chemotaxis protein